MAPSQSKYLDASNTFFYSIEAKQTLFLLEKAVAECISDDALIHLKSYKYSSVDKSPISKYVLGPWVRFNQTLVLALLSVVVGGLTEPWGP